MNFKTFALVALTLTGSFAKAQSKEQQAVEQDTITFKSIDVIDVGTVTVRKTFNGETTASDTVAVGIKPVVIEAPIIKKEDAVELTAHQKDFQSFIETIKSTQAATKAQAKDEIDLMMKLDSLRQSYVPAEQVLMVDWKKAIEDYEKNKTPDSANAYVQTLTEMKNYLEAIIKFQDDAMVKYHESKMDKPDDVQKAFMQSFMSQSQDSQTRMIAVMKIQSFELEKSREMTDAAPKPKTAGTNGPQ